MFVYALLMSPEERAWFVAGLAARRGAESGIAYAFFTENCATMAWKMLRALLLPLRWRTLAGYGRGGLAAMVRARPGPDRGFR